MALRRVGISLPSALRPLAVFALLLLIWTATCVDAWAAGSERYDYDGLGRLVRVIQGDGTVTEYTYDPAGNITEVKRGSPAVPPTITSVQPSSIRQASRTRVVLSGSNLANASVTADDRELDISSVTRGASTIEFDLAVSAAAKVGASTLRVTSAAGSGTGTITVRPALPTVTVSPLPIAVPPDGRSAVLEIVLSSVDDVAHTIALSTVRPEIARVTPASVTISAGSTRASIQVAGIAGGNTELKLDSATLGSTSFPIFVTAQFQGITTARAALVGVTLAAPPSPPSGFSGLFASPLVGVVRGGSTWIDTQPRFVAQGGSQTIVVSGNGLPAGLVAAVEPPDGLTLGVPAVDADGRKASITVTASAGAVQGPRRLLLTSAGAPLTPVTQGADLLDVVAPVPVLTSVEPIVLVPGTTVPAFTIRGRNLQDVTSVQVQGGGITVSNTLTPNADGSALQVALQVSPVAQAGQRVVVVFAPSGSSSAVPTPANTLQVVIDETGISRYADLAAPAVGVVKGASGPPPRDASYAIQAPIVGVALGPLAVSSTPSSILRGETIDLRVQGQYLQGVTALALSPADGLTLGSLSVDPDGRSVRVPVTADALAPLGNRRIDVLAGATPVGVGGSGSLTLQVASLPPVVDSVTPNSVVPNGLPVPLSIRGRNLQGASEVRISPSADISIEQPSVDSEGREVQVNIAIAPTAARGPRTVTVVTPGGESSSVAGPSNQLVIANGIAVFDLPSALVGVKVGEPAPPPPNPPIDAWVAAPLVGLVVGNDTSIGPSKAIVAANVGVVLAGSPPPVTRDVGVTSAVAGVVVGPVITRLEPEAWVIGTSGTLTVRGLRIPAGSSVKFSPADAVTLNGGPTVDADGSAVRQGISVSGAASAPALEVTVVTAAGDAIATASTGPEARTLWLSSGLPEIVSIEPILARRGEVVELIVRGTGLGDVQRVAAEPSGGIDFAPTFTVNSSGTELTIRMALRSDAPLGPRVIRVFNRIGGSSPNAGPPNTFTVLSASAVIGDKPRPRPRQNR